MLNKITKKIISLFQLIVVMIYIIFEELIWESFAKPIYNSIHSLKILQKIENRLKFSNPSSVLALFVLLLILVEGLGIYAGILFVSGQVFLGIALYISKIPIAAFTFWLFRITEDKLMKFEWFKWFYDKIISSIEWIKSTNAYMSTMKKLSNMKISIKKHLKSLKDSYFKDENTFMIKIKNIYNSIKDTLKR